MMSESNKNYMDRIDAGFDRIAASDGSSYLFNSVKNCYIRIDNSKPVREVFVKFKNGDESKTEFESNTVFEAMNAMDFRTETEYTSF